MALKVIHQVSDEYEVVAESAPGSVAGKPHQFPTRIPVPAGTGRLYLRLSKATKQRLANLPRKRKLRMVVEVKATGAPTVSAEISLPGRKKPRRPLA